MITGIVYNKAFLNYCPDSIEIGHWDSGGSKSHCLLPAAASFLSIHPIIKALGNTVAALCSQYLTLDGAYPEIVTGAEKTCTGLAKDEPRGCGSDLEHKKAVELAIEQTKHEWCRVFNLVRHHYGDAGVKKLLDEWHSERNSPCFKAYEPPPEPQPFAELSPSEPIIEQPLEQPTIQQPAPEVPFVPEEIGMGFTTEELPPEHRKPQVKDNSITKAVLVKEEEYVNGGLSTGVGTDGGMSSGSHIDVSTMILLEIVLPMEI